MIPVIIILIAWWAGSGVVTRIRGDRAAGPGQAAASSSGPGAAAKTTAPNAAASTTRAAQSRRPLAPGDVTFRQWQRSLYDRSKAKIRPHIPGRRLGKKATDLLGDVTAAALAGSLAFGMGFTLGGAWAGARMAQRRTQKKTQAATGAPKNGPTGSGRRQPRNPRPGTPPGGAGFHPRRTTQDQTPPRYATGGVGDAVPVFELLDDGTAPTSTADSSQYVSDEYADIVGQPQLLAHNPDTNGTRMASEILTIHDLFAFAQQVTPAVLEAAEQAAIRKNSALERAEQAAIRGNVAVARAENAVQVAATARDQAAQLEGTIARFSGLNVDSESLAAIYSALEAMHTLALREEQRAEAEAQVAVDAEKIAQDEQVAAAAAEASAQAAMAAAESVQAMHDTVQARQMPHAEAQAITGNAAAHESVLAAS